MLHLRVCLPFIVLLQNKDTTLAENVENLKSAQPRVSAHSQVPRAVNRINTVYVAVNLLSQIIFIFSFVSTLLAYIT